MVMPAANVNARKIGTVGTIGQGTKAAILATFNVDTRRYGRQWFTFETIELLGLLHVPIAEIVVRVHEKGSVRL